MLFADLLRPLSESFLIGALMHFAGLQGNSFLGVVPLLPGHSLLLGSVLLLFLLLSLLLFLLLLLLLLLWQWVRLPVLVLLQWVRLLCLLLPLLHLLWLLLRRGGLPRLWWRGVRVAPLPAPFSFSLCFLFDGNASHRIFASEIIAANSSWCL